MIDRRAMTGPGGVALEDERSSTAFANGPMWRGTRAGSFGCNSIIGAPDPGQPRQQAPAPSAVALDLGGFSDVRQAQGE
jgi:hypothetical protein